jgi:hypothetical protein
MVLLLAGLRLRLGTIEGGALARSAGRTLSASVVAGVAGWGVARGLAPSEAVGPLRRALPGVTASVVFGVVFLAAAWGLRAPELAEIAGAARRRLRR